MNTPRTDALSAELNDKPIPPKVWREMAKLEQENTRLTDLLYRIDTMITETNWRTGSRAESSKLIAAVLKLLASLERKP